MPTYAELGERLKEEIVGCIRTLKGKVTLPQLYLHFACRGNLAKEAIIADAVRALCKESRLTLHDDVYTLKGADATVVLTVVAPPEPAPVPVVRVRAVRPQLPPHRKMTRKDVQARLKSYIEEAGGSLAWDDIYQRALADAIPLQGIGMRVLLRDMAQDRELLRTDGDVFVIIRSRTRGKTETDAP